MDAELSPQDLEVIRSLELMGFVSAFDAVTSAETITVTGDPGFPDEPTIVG